MELEEMVLERLRSLPPEQRREVLDFAEFLHLKGNTKRTPRKSLEGALAGQGIDLALEDIREARREMWKSFPRDIEP